MKHALIALLLPAVLSAETQITWQRQQLQAEFYSEGAAIGDINGDGRNDVVAGPFWWEGPAFEKKHAFYPPKPFSIQGYSDNFFAYVHDFNADRKNDILVLGFPGKEARLYLNPAVHDDTPWPMHLVADVVDNESPVFTDITGDGKPEIVCSTGGKFGWFAPNWDKPTEKWNFVAVTDDMKVAKFTHGLGVGDVNGDGKNDLLEARHWWEAPSSNSEPGTANFIQHSFAAGIGGGAQMFAYDFDGNGTNDVFTALAAHRYGVAVFLQAKNPAPGTATWQKVMLASEQPQDNDYGIVFSQPHAAALADLDGDGVKDIVTGKRYWAHNGKGDPDERGHRVLYWYQTKRDGKGGVEFVPHLVDANSGVGVDVQVGDVNGDALPDIVVGNKGGVYVFTQQRREISAAEAQAMQPRKLYGPGLMPQKDYATGQPPGQALKNLQLPTGFQADLIAAEPDLVQPIAFTFDERGRIWVIEGNSYPKPREVGAGQDRIRILEDRDGDGRYETKKTFCEGINLASGIELGFGGVWVGAAPYLMFIPREGDRTLPLNKSHNSYETYPKVPGLNFTAYALLDGWGSQDTHETLNSFLWGPDGWLYGCHGVFTHSRVGKPGTPDERRQPLNAAVWRYHPVRHEFEIFAHGTSNPWGLDYDAHGEFFVTACVIPHLYHIVPGGRYHRQAGQHFNAHTYEDIKTIADHAHYAGTLRPNIEFNKTTGAGLANDDTNALGGGHAHCGLAIYQSSQFPATYRNQLLFGNLHGHRLVSNYTEPKASTYIGRHGPDFLRANDMHFIPVTQKVGPDGALYVSDWSDQQICHRGSNAVENWDRSNGRMYRVRYGEGSAGTPARSQASGGEAAKSPEADKSVRAPLFPAAPFDLAKETDEKLAQLAVQTENEWFSRMARRMLMERAVTEKLDAGWAEGLAQRTANPKPASVPAQLRQLWLNAVIAPAADLQNASFEASVNERLVVQGIRLATARPDFADTDLRVLGEAAKTHSSPLIRRELASALQRLPVDQRQALATALLQRGEDKDDPMIPLLIWYGIEPLVGADAEGGLELARVSKLPKVTQFIYRRLGAEEAGRTALLRLAAASADTAERASLLTSVVEAARAGNKVAKPADWDTLRVKLDGAPAGLLPELEAFMGIESAIASFRERLTSTAPVDARLAALKLLVQLRDGDTAALLHQMLGKAGPGHPALRRAALQALATLPHPQTPAVLGGLLPALTPVETNDAIATLATTPEGAKTLLLAVKEAKVAKSLLSPFLARQMEAQKNAEVSALLKEVWGDLNAPKADLEPRKAKFRALLTPAALAKADPAQGKALYTAVCGTCHTLFGQGAKVGPDLTGSNRTNLEYLLDNVLDPNAVIGKDYQLNIFELADGRLASGIIKDETSAAWKVAMPGGLEQLITKAEVKKRTVSPVSTMPEGLFDALPPEQLVHLVAWLQGAGDAGAANGRLEGETLPTKASAGKASPQAMGNFSEGRWSGDRHLFWTGGKPGETLTVTFPVKEAGRRKVHAVLTKAPDYGQVRLTINGVVASTVELDLYDAKVTNTEEILLGEFDLKAGEQKLEITISGANPKAKAARWFAALDYLRLE
jgi:putative membrane-bound dehydrogenase-like protein